VRTTNTSVHKSNEYERTFTKTVSANMSSLADFESVLQALKSKKKKNVDLLHKFVYENDGDRHSRKRLRVSTGLTFWNMISFLIRRCLTLR